MSSLVEAGSAHPKSQPAIQILGWPVPGFDVIKSFVATDDRLLLR